jgi:hypothetical protein
MKRALLVLCLTIGVVFTTTPAQADHATHDFFTDGSTTQAIRWHNAPGDWEFCISGDFESLLGASQEANAVDSIDEADWRWGADTGINQSAVDSASGFCGNYNFPAEWNAANEDAHTFCNNLPEPGFRRASVQFDNISQDFGGAPAATVTCDRDNDGYLDYFVIVINSYYDPTTEWHYSFGADPNQGHWDFPGVMMHEFGHAYGWDLHMNNWNQTACPQTWSGWSTMCGTYSYGYFPTSSSAGTADRTLGSHDIGETNEWY